MARPVYSHSFWNGTIVGNNTETIDIPPNFVAVVRSIEGVITTDPFSGLLVSVGFEVPAFGQWTAPTNYVGGISWNGHVVAPGPTVLEIQVLGVDESISLSISGYLLSA